MKTISSCPSNRYPRTLSVWTKAEDKALIKAIDSGLGVLEIAEDLAREHVSVIRRISELEIFKFDEFTDEWVEMMGLGMAGVPLAMVIDWCTASPTRLPLADLEALAMGDLRQEFALAAQHLITVSSSDSVVDLSWLAAQPPVVQARYGKACESLLDCFDVVTPLTLRREVMGLSLPFVPPVFSDGVSIGKKPAYRRGHTRRTTTRHSGFVSTAAAKPTYRRKARRYGRIKSTKKGSCKPPHA